MAYCFWSVRASVGACVTLFVPTVNFKPFQIWTLNFCYCDSSKTVIARSFKHGQLIEDDEYITWCSFEKKNEKKLFYIFEVIAFMEKRFVGGIMFHKHYF